MKAFACPQCGASLESDVIYGATAECPYCHSTVIVPQELRPAPPPPTPTPPPMVSGYATGLGPKQAFSFSRALTGIAIAIVLFLVFILLIPNRETKTSSYTAPVPPRTLPTVSPTPAGFSFGEKGTGPGFFDEAQQVAVDGDGNIYVSDNTLRIQKFDSQGKFLNLWTIPSSTQYFKRVRGGPSKLLADRQGRMFVVIGGVVLKYDGARGEWISVAHGVDYIYDAALKADGGTVLVSGNGADDELVVLDPQGKATTRIHKFISSQLDNQISVEALRVAVDGVGNIFAIYALGSVYGEYSYDNEDLAVFRFTADGKYVNRFGGGGSEPGQFDSPSAIAVDGHGRVYVCDLTRGISVFTDGGRYLKTYNTPFWVHGMAFDPAGDLLIVGDNKVSKIVMK